MPFPGIIQFPFNKHFLRLVSGTKQSHWCVMCAVKHYIHIFMTVFFFSESCWGNAMVVYTKPRPRKKEESEQLRGERDQIKFIDLRFERWDSGKVVRLRKARRRQDVP